MDKVKGSSGGGRNYARVGRLITVLLIGASLAACTPATATPTDTPTPTPTATVSPTPTPGFSPTGSMKTSREVHTATLLPDGRVLIAGGFGVSTPLASAEL